MMNGAARSFGLRDSGAVAPSAPDESGLSHAAREDYHGSPAAGLEAKQATSEVFAMNNHGAIHTGVHRCYMLAAGAPEKLVEISRFSNLWHQDDKGNWTLTRVLSYDHRTTE